MTVTCPSCGKRYRVEDQSSGQRLACRVCGGAIDVPVFSTANPFVTGASMQVRELEYSPTEADQQVEIAGAETIDRVVPWVMLAGFLGYVILSASSSIPPPKSTGPNAHAYGAGYAIGRALGMIVMVAGIGAPLCVLGVFIASRIMKFTNRPMLYWRCLAVMATPFATLLVASGFDLHRLPRGPLPWLALLPMFGVLWLMLRLRGGPYAVAAAFVLLCGVGGPIVLAVVIAVPFVLMAGSRGSVASIAPPATGPSRTTVARATPLTGDQMRILRPLVEQQMKRVGAALQAYSAMHAGQYPRTLTHLQTAGLLGASDAKPIGGTGGWLYSSHGLMAPLPAEMVIVHDGAGADLKRTCLFGDGHVESVSLADWPEVNRASVLSVGRGVKGRP